MKRSAPLVRTTALRRVPMRRGRVQLARTKPLKARRRTKAERDAWAILKAQVWYRDDGRCRRCRGTSTLDPHHILPKGRGGKDALDNLMLLCRRDHDWAHGNPKAAEAAGFLRGTRA